MTDEEFLRSVFDRATRDLHAPALAERPAGQVLPLPARRRRRTLLPAAAAAAAVAVLAVAALWPATHGPAPRQPGRAPGRVSAGAATPAGATALYRLAAVIRTLPTPAERYAVGIERQTQGATSYLKATIIDSHTGDTWTYQQGPGVPAALPMAAGFSPTEAQLQSTDPTDPARLEQALIAQAAAANPDSRAAQTPADLAVTQAIDTLWNPLVQPKLRAALVSVIASFPNVRTQPHARDARGRAAIEVSYDDSALGVRQSVYLDPSTGVVLEDAEQPYGPSADPSLAGTDVYLSHYWTDAAPTVNPLTRGAPPTPGTAGLGVR